MSIYSLQFLKDYNSKNQAIYLLYAGYYIYIEPSLYHETFI